MDTIIDRGAPKARNFEPYASNGGSIVAISGKDFAIVASDTRLSEGYMIYTRKQSKLFQLSDKSVLGCTGCWCDTLSLTNIIQSQLKSYLYDHNTIMQPNSIAQLLSTLLYSRRFFPYYVYNVLAGLDINGEGCLYSYDPVGHCEKVNYTAGGSSGVLMQPFLDSWLANRTAENPITEEEALSLVKDAFTAAGERDIYTGDEVVYNIIKKDGIKTDIVGPLPITKLGNTHILTMQDELIRYALAVALASTDVSTVARAFVECCVCIFGIPTSILTDCGTDFLSDVFKAMCKLLDIEKSKTTPWHSQTNGYLERKPNIPSTLTREPEPQYNYDNYVFDLKKIMQETHKFARDNLIKKKENNKKYYDKTKNPITLHMEDKILLKDQNKKNTLAQNWTGPYEIVIINDNENITIKRDGKTIALISTATLVRFLREEKAEFHTYQLKEDKPTRVVIRNLHPTTPLELIKSELEQRLFEVRQLQLICLVTSAILKKPKSLALGEFFDFHPHQPYLTHPFKSSKVFLGKNNIQRRWLTYDEHSEKLFCSVCLAFSSERNIFIDGFNTWSHVYQRVQEHEIIKSHNLSLEAFLNYSSKKTIDYRLFSEHLHKKKIEVTKNRNILQRVIDVIKLIGKRGLSYRGHRNEGADSLNDSTLDHGNFLDILLLLKKYDVVLCEHIDSITKNASVNYKKGKGKGRGASLTFISKTTVNMVIDSISYLMKKSISDEIRDAVMFSVQLDTTQDISVQDQCSIILRYVNYKGIQERLLAVITVQQSTGKSFSDMLQGVLADNGLDVMKCIGNATDAAANMQGQFNGFSAWLEKSTPNQVHVWCYSHILNLVIIDSTKSPLKAAALFVTLNDLANYFKESYKRKNVWVNFVGENNKKRLQSISNTRWWSKEVALKHIFGSDGMYIDVILVLNSIENSNGFTPEARLKAKTLKN
ncbi:hypothetical protein QTP88_026173 [Uroleucon formosanum]